MKGDGVQSLAAIALLRRAAMDRGRSRTFVFAVEEPEAHLHPLTVRELRRMPAQIASDQQVVVTAHSPLLADPLRVERNVIVEDSRAHVARKIAEVRDCLGVRLEENLQSARLAVVVEGGTDVAILRSVLPVRDPLLAAALADGALVVEGLGGGDKLSYRLSQYACGVCGVFVFVDNDAQGRSAVEAATRQGLLSDADYRLAAAAGKAESEIEDLVDPHAYLGRLNSHFGLSLTRSAVRKGTKKWSSRLGVLVTANGKVWNAGTERKAKEIVAGAVAENPTSAIDDSSTITSEIVESLLAKLKGTGAP